MMPFFVKLLVLVLFLISPGYAYFRQSLIFNGKTTITRNLSCDSEIGYIVDTWKVDDDNYYKYTFTLKNISVANFYYWDISFLLPNDGVVTSVSSCGYTMDGNKVTLSNLDYNGYLEINNSTNLELQFKTRENFTLSAISVNNCYSNPIIGGDIEANKDFGVDFIITNSWGNYTSQYDIVLTNKGNTKITSWSFEAVMSNVFTLSGSWSTNYVVSDNSIIFSNMDYNGTLEPNNSITIGAIITTTTPNYIPTIKNKLITN